MSTIPDHMLPTYRAWLRGWEQSHICNAYCRDGEHCELAYGSGPLADPACSDARALRLFAAAYGDNFGRLLEITRAQRAREAGPSPNHIDVLWQGVPQAESPWLVWMRAHTA